MKEAEKDGKRIAEEVLKQNRITSHEDFAGKAFLDLQYGDLVMVHKGSYPMALVEIIERLPEVQDPSFGIDYRVKILSDFTEALSKFPELMKLNGATPHTGTFFSISDPNTNTYKSVNQWYSLIMEEQFLTETENLLRYKKQIILQGPPGTGKTRIAKQLAFRLAAPGVIKTLDAEIMKEIFEGTHEITTLARGSAIKLKKVAKNGAVHLVNRNGTGSAVSIDKVKEIAGTNKGSSYEKAVLNHVFKKLNENSENTQVRLVQFHPSYSYEDFVRGISASGDGEKVFYKTENKSLAAFAKKALKNLENTKKDTEQLAKEHWIEKEWYDFVELIEEKIANEGSYPLTPKVSVVAIEEDCLRYRGDAWKTLSRINFSDAKMLIEKNLKRVEGEITIDKTVSSQAYYRSTYYRSLLQEFFKDRSFKGEKVSRSEELENYVLIIDEINRANLPAVLGELIYALEYRGEPVNSMYQIDGRSEITIPENLYIIGTMNTADRSVGHIDYAIQRRFAFVEMLPRELDKSELEDGDEFRLDQFKEVKQLFVNEEGKASKHLSTEFNERPQDVWIGHSYFIAKKDVDFKMRLKYEVAPILEEYVKDGILKNDAEVNRVITNYKA